MRLVRLVLASASPRRAELMTAAGFVFDTVPADVDERVLPGELPEDHVRRLALAKATAIADWYPHCGAAAADAEVAPPAVAHDAPAEGTKVAVAADTAVIVAADTVVVIDGLILGKPENDEAAAGMLRRLSGRSHDVLTGLCVRCGSRARQAVERSTVTFATLHEDEIRSYVASREPRDKAGAYAIQGLASKFVVAVEGSYSNVVGLPVSTLYRLLLDLGLTV
ncbi:MAG: Maf family protein [Acidobacteria bacterium]|nr:Maf family protein [Acidobacteriota bacterium]